MTLFYSYILSFSLYAKTRRLLSAGLCYGKKTTPGGAVNNVTESVGKNAEEVGVVSIFNYNASDRFAARNNDYR